MPEHALKLMTRQTWPDAGKIFTNFTHGYKATPATWKISDKTIRRQGLQQAFFDNNAGCAGCVRTISAISDCYL